MIRLGEDYVLEVAIAPEGALAKLRSAINKRPQRAFGVIKIAPEWVGVVRGTEFEIWERRQHATHAHGRVRGRHGGSRIEARIELTRRARVLTVLFFVLFVLAAIGLAGLPDSRALDATSLLVVVLGGATLAGLYWTASIRQRSALRRFIAEVFADTPRP